MPSFSEIYIKTHPATPEFRSLSERPLPRLCQTRGVNWPEYIFLCGFAVHKYAAFSNFNVDAIGGVFCRHGSLTPYVVGALYLPVRFPIPPPLIFSRYCMVLAFWLPEMSPEKAHTMTLEWYAAWSGWNHRMALPRLIPTRLIQNIKESIINRKWFHRHRKLKLTIQHAPEIRMLLRFNPIEAYIWQFAS